MSDFMDRSSSYEEQTGNAGDGYTRIYWMNGEPRDNTPGRFWLLPDALESAGITAQQPWKLITHTFNDGKKKDIVVAPAIRIAPICWRQQTYIRDTQNNGVAGWITERRRGKLEAGQSIFFEMLSIVEGLDTPVVMSNKGVKASMAWLAEILPAYKEMRDEIRKQRNNQIVPPWWFWLAIRSDLDEKKQPKYEKTPQGKAITPPKWIKPANLLERDTWKQMYVGNEWADVGEDWYLNGGKAWAARLISESYSASTETTEPQPTGRNVPQPIDEGVEVPF